MNHEKKYKGKRITHSPPQLPKSGALAGRRRPGRRWPRLRARVAVAGRALAAAPAARLAAPGRARERGRFGESCVREREEERDLGEKINLFLPLSYYNNFLNILILLYVPLVFIS